MFSKRQAPGRDADQERAAAAPARLGEARPAAHEGRQTPRAEPPRPAAPQRPIAAGGSGRSVILEDLVIKGAILARGELELHGLVEGDVIALSVVIGPTATIRGDILGEQVSISGEVRGRVSGHRVHLGAQARYRGDIRRDAIAIDEGAQFEGSVSALDDAGRREIAHRLEGGDPLPREAPRPVLAPTPAAVRPDPSDDATGI